MKIKSNSIAFEIHIFKSIVGLYVLFAIVFAFMVDGFWWGMLNIILPISPFIHLVKYFISTGLVKI